MPPQDGSATTALPAPAPSPKAGERGRLRATLLRQDVLLLIVLIAMTAFFSAMNPRFFSTVALANILQDFAPVMLLAIGQTYVILTGGIDLSVGSTLGLSGVTTALTIRALADGALPVAAVVGAGLVVAVATGLLVGLVNGVLITRAGLAPFIATLAMLGAGAGMTLVLTGGVQIAGAPAAVIAVGNDRYLQVLTTPLVAVLLVLAICWAMLEYTRFGRWTYAIGSNAFAARGAGIDVKAHLMKVYALTGVLAGLAGAFVFFRLGSGSPTSGQGQELNAIAAAVIGGVLLTGGVGRMSGTVLGALLTTSVLSGLILIGVAPNWQQVVVGVLIAAAVAVQQFTRLQQKKG